MALSHSYRISKYDPAKRSTDDQVLGGEWTFFTEIGQDIHGRLLTYADYYAVESKYVETVLSFLDEAGANALTVLEMSVRFQSLVKSDDLFRDITLTEEAIFAGAIAEGSVIPRNVWADVIRLSLRDAIWCKLDGPQDFKIRFGWDYSIYVSSHAKAQQSEARAAALGLFVETGILPIDCK